MLNTSTGTTRTVMNQWLVSDNDLSLVNWTLTGKVMADWGSVPMKYNSNQLIAFDIRTQSSANAIPEPGLWRSGDSALAA